MIEDHEQVQADGNDAGQADDHSFGDHGLGGAGDEGLYDYAEEQAQPEQADFSRKQGADAEHNEPRSLTTTVQSERARFGQTQVSESVDRQHNQTLQLKSLEQSSPKKVNQKETIEGLNRNSYLVSRYHHLRQFKPRISAQTIKFAGERIEPPQCLLDILDALFSLVHGIFTPLEDGYFSDLNRKYACYKKYLKHSDELISVLASLKSTLEEEGLPTKNLLMADRALCRYKKSVKKIEPRSYVDPTNEIYKFVYFFLEYFNLMRVGFNDIETAAGA